MAGRSCEFAFDFIKNKDENKELQKYSLSYSLKYFLLGKKNYEAVSHLYSEMNLFDNTELLKLLHSDGRGTGVWLAGISAKTDHGKERELSPLAGFLRGTKGQEQRKNKKEKMSGKDPFSVPELDLNFSTVIYADILKLAVDSVVDRHNTRLFKLIEYFIQGTILAGTSQEDENYLRFFRLFQCLYFYEPSENAYTKVSYTFARDFYHKIFEEDRDTVKASGITGINADSGEFQSASLPMIQVQNKAVSKNNLQNGNIHKIQNDYFRKLTEDIMREMSRYLGVSGTIRFYSEIRRYHPGHISSTDPSSPLRRPYMIFESLLASWNFTSDMLAQTSSVWTDRKIYRILSDLITSCYPDALRQSQLDDAKSDFFPSRKYYPEAEEILTQLYLLLLTDCAISCITVLQEDFYKNFNFDKITNLHTIKEMKLSVSKMHEELNLSHRRSDELEAKLARQEKLLHRRQEDAYEAFRQELGAMQRENSDLKDENEELKRKLARQEEYISLLEQPAPDAGMSESTDQSGPMRSVELNDECMGLLHTKKFLFVGGQQDVIRQLATQFQTSVFVENVAVPVNLSNIDYMVMFVKFMSHALYYKYIDAARNLDIPVIYCNMSNYDMVLQKLYDSVSQEK